MKRAGILLADDHPLTMDGIQSVLASRYDVVGTVTDGRALVDAALLLRPDLVVADISMPLLNGIDAARQIRKALPDTPVLIVTMHVSRDYVNAAFAAGATGYVLKSAAGEELLGAVAEVLSGGTYLSPAIAGGMPSANAGQAHGPRVSYHLTSRERETLQLIAEGKSAKEIAWILDISVSTVTFHRENLKQKLQAKTTAELTKAAIRQGLVDAGVEPDPIPGQVTITP